MSYLTILTRRARRAAGSALAAAAVSAGVLSIVVVGYLSYMSNEYALNFRSHRWTQALHLAEAAVEVGFAEYHYQYFLGHNGFTSGRGWISVGAGSYSKTVTNFVDNTSTVVGDLTVTVSGVGTGAPKVLGVGTCSTTPRGPTINRAVRVTLAPSASFPTAMAAKDDIDLKGNNIYIDSFDSTDPTKSTGGLYDYGKRQVNGNVATNSELENSLSIGNADVYGNVATGPNGSVAIGAQGSIGPTLVEVDRATTAEDGEAEGWIRHDFQVDMPDVVLPSGLSSSYDLGNVSSSIGIHGGDWRIENLNLEASKYMSINGNVRLYITGDIDVTGSAYIIVQPGATLQIYCAGGVKIAGNGVLNDASRAIDCRFYGLPTSSSWDINGNGQWVGTVYAPNAEVNVAGGGTDGDMSGSIVADTIRFNGHTRFHYDESLETNNSNTGYLVASWQSLKLVGGSWVAE
ncbi:hypothetical protein HQ590_09680 [bacterium]|nr:hypothetical protein [bacterium]